MKKRTKKPASPAAQYAAEHGSAAVRTGSELLSMLVAAGLLVAVVWLLCMPVMPGGTFINTVQGDSMAPTLINGQRVFASSGEPKRGDIVVCHVPSNGGEESMLIKRIIAMPGDTLKILPGEVYVNGKRLPEEYLSLRAVAGTYLIQSRYQDLTLGTDEYYLMGDNREYSYDSRFFGPVKGEKILAVQSTAPTQTTWQKGAYFLVIAAASAVVVWHLTDWMQEGVYWLLYRKKLKNAEEEKNKGDMETDQDIT